MTMNLNFDVPLVDTRGLPTHSPLATTEGKQGGGETKSGSGGGGGSGGSGGSGGGESKTHKRPLQEIEAEYREKQEKIRLAQLDAKEAREKRKQCVGYEDESGRGSGDKLKVWFYRINSDERVLIKAKTTSLVSDLYAIVDFMATGGSSGGGGGGSSSNFHLVDKQERRLPRPSESNGLTTTFLDLGLTKKNIKIYQKVPQASECDVVLRLASNICKRHRGDLRSINASNEKEVRYFLNNLPLIQAMHLSMNGRSNDSSSSGSGSGSVGESKQTSVASVAAAPVAAPVSTNVSELVEHLIPYVQKDANVADVAWAPPGGMFEYSLLLAISIVNMPVPPIEQY